MSRKITKDKGISENRGLPKRSAIIKLVLLVVTTATVFGFYRVMMNFKYFEIVMATYMIALAAFAVAYFVYNRGFSRRGVTVDMLPDEWTDAQKEEFVSDAATRQKKSAWMLMLVFALIFTFAFDLLELYLLPFIDGLLTK
jgi:purine-cytosine permease-like protein